MSRKYFLFFTYNNSKNKTTSGILTSTILKTKNYLWQQQRLTKAKSTTAKVKTRAMGKEGVVGVEGQ